MKGINVNDWLLKLRSLDMRSRKLILWGLLICILGIIIANAT